jgi:hypothetical protein
VSKAWRGGSTRAWRKLRAEILEANRVNNGGRCQAQVKHICSGLATIAHHTRGREVTGDDPRYIVGVCKPCNLHIGNPIEHEKKCRLCVADHDPAPLQLTDW